jgi:hypothetical protein
MNLEQTITQMTHNAGTILALTKGVSDKQSRWRPDADAWSILEVINHLLDEEKEDFRVRLDYILHRPEQRWPPIDPGGWVTSREYNQRILESSLIAFLNARQESLAWLQELPSPDWQKKGKAPWGTISAGDMFAAWVSHDLLHIRQLVELHWAYTMRRLEPFDPQYAGSW